MCGPEEAVIGPSEQSPIDEIMTRRIACRDFCDAPIPRRTIEQILHVARFAPSGANIQPGHVCVLSGAAKANVNARSSHGLEGSVQGSGSGGQHPDGAAGTSFQQGPPTKQPVNFGAVWSASAV
ncbi:hypothetical protein BST63_06740 [Bradyrhizobium canariense]|uniref:Nitroreductase domain-containing protein n=2 Tax=Bradyrhizobium canariense TaxID=255045 RepID=A0ABX3X8H4_9BRAD|nr:hypothetical protein BSR47_07720 [Bradyrhizobium canariense]OSJ32854.1 hypothetical protein BST63_06740 [Bradyrhizobium canariense]